jgi:cation-transporting ATPase 13A2
MVDVMRNGRKIKIDST